MTPKSLIARKELDELILSTRGLMWLLASAVGMSTFALLLVSNTELSLLDNAQVVYDMLGIVTALACLLALISGVDTLGGERERQTLVPLLLAPVARNDILTGKLTAILGAWAVMFLLSIPYVWAVGSTGQNLGSGYAVLLIFGTPVVLSFGYFGLWLGTRVRQTVAAYMTGLITIVVAASPLVLGPALRQSAIGRAFDTVNPFSAAVNAYDAVVIDSMPVFSQWGSLITVLIWLGVTFTLTRRGFAALET
jgi:ABC-type transport system involved in multi-copper enzyme maturation permease subunit